jgi:hypothetical protein
MRWRVVVVVVPVLLEIQTEVEERALEDFLCHEQEGDQQPAAAIARWEGEILLVADLLDRRRGARSSPGSGVAQERPNWPAYGRVARHVPTRLAATVTLAAG